MYPQLMRYRRTLPHVDPEAPQGLLHRALAPLVDNRLMIRVEGSLPYRLLVWRTVPRLMRLTGGRLAFLLPVPVGVIETRDARNGRLHRRAAVYFNDGDDVILTPSKSGLPDDPHWYRNAIADPEVRFEGEPYRAHRVEDPASLERLWALADRVHGAAALYRERAAKSGRTIPVLRLVPETPQPLGSAAGDR